jgi:hypothetical protein
MRAEVFYKNNYCQKGINENDNNEGVVNTNFSAFNQENIRTLFNTTLRENIEKTFITRTVQEEKNNVIVETQEKESFTYNSHTGQINTSFNNKKSGLFTKRSHDNSIQNILYNLDENFNNINERIIDKIQKSKKIVRNNYSTTDKTKADENNFNNITKLKNSLKEKEDLINIDNKKTISGNKSTQCLFNSCKSNNQSVRQVIIPEYNISRIKGIPLQKNKINIKLRYKDVNDILNDKSPLGENSNNIKFSSKIKEYKELNLKKIYKNSSHYHKSYDPKNKDHSSKPLEYSYKKNHSTKICEKNNKNLIYFSNTNSEKNLIVKETVDKGSRNINPINTFKASLTLISKKDVKREKSNEELKSETKYKEIINNPQLNISKSIFSKHTHSKSSLHSTNNFKIGNIKLPKKDINTNNYFSNRKITNSRNKKNSIFKNNSNSNLLSPKADTISNNLKLKSKDSETNIINEANKLDKIVYSSCIDLQYNSGITRLINRKIKEKEQSINRKEIFI